MRRYLLDSNALNHFIYRRCGGYERGIRERKRGLLGTAIPIVGEFLGGLELSDTRDANRPIVERELETLKLWPYDLPAARAYARTLAALHRQGIVMQVIDLMTAAVALTIPRCTVVTSDSDFTRVPGLDVVDWRS